MDDLEEKVSTVGLADIDQKLSFDMVIEHIGTALLIEVLLQRLIA